MQVIKTKTVTYKTSAKPPKLKDCPYCKSELTLTEKDFFPCSCAFQACVNCYEDILHNKGLCPSCHKPLRASRVKALHVSKKEEMQKSEMEKLGREKLLKKCTTTTIVTTVSSKHPHANSHTQVVKTEPRVQLPKMSFAELTKLRIIQRNLVYIIGLAPQIAKPEVLERLEYFGQYGKISKIVVNKGNAYNSASPSGPSFSAYITFAKEIDASIAIMAADQFVLYDRTLRTSYGTTKYCTFLLKGQTCPNSDCLYLHSVENREELLIRDETITNKEIFMDQQKLTVDFIEKHYDEVMRKTNPDIKTKTVLPSVSAIQAKIQRMIDHRLRERKDREQAKNRSAHKESNKENVDSNLNSLPSSARKSVNIDTRSSNQDIGSANGSLSPTKTSTRKESRVEDNSEALHSHRSSSSNWSTTDCSIKKDILADHKEDVDLKNHTQNHIEQKEHENELDAVEEEEKVKNPFIELMEANIAIQENNEKKDEEEDAFKDNFDKSIYERITNNLYNVQTSRFQCTQERDDEEPEFDDTKLVQVNFKNNEESEDFREISKSIMDFVDIQADETVSENKDNIDTLIYQNKCMQDKLEKAKLNTAMNGKMTDVPLKSVTEENLNNMNQNNMRKSKLDKIKQVTQKGLNNSNSYSKPVYEDGFGLNASGKQPINKSAEYNTVNKNIDGPNYNMNTNIHTRHNYKMMGHKLSNFKCIQ